MRATRRIRDEEDEEDEDEVVGQSDKKNVNMCRLCARYTSDLVTAPKDAESWEVDNIWPEEDKGIVGVADQEGYFSLAENKRVEEEEADVETVPVGNIVGGINNDSAITCSSNRNSNRTTDNEIESKRNIKSDKESEKDNDAGGGRDSGRDRYKGTDRDS